jgi:two-component system, OmpR family, sensor histidine kinase BaeS
MTRLIKLFQAKVWRVPLSVRLAGMMVLVVLGSMLTFTVSFGAIASIRFSNMPKDQQDRARQLQDNGIFLAPESFDRLALNGISSGLQTQVGLKPDPSLNSNPNDSSPNVYSGAALLTNPLSLNLQLPTKPKSPRRGSDFFFKALGSSQLISIAISAMLGIMLATVFARRLAQPLEAVSKAARKMRRGDLSARAPVPPSRFTGEPEDLAMNFNAMADSLERQERERKNMVADIAHELRTPIGVMQAKLEAIEDGVFPLSIDEIKKLSKQTQLLARLVQDLRTLSLADAGQLQLETRSFNLAAKIREITSGFEPSAQQKLVKLEVRAPEKLELHGDPDRIAQVLTNLLDNALRYTPEHGSVCIALESTQNTARVIVSDSGQGLPSESLEHVFDRFYRVDESRNRSSGGSGLGLAIARTILELHGGKISVQNRLEGGAEFVCALPVA